MMRSQRRLGNRHTALLALACVILVTCLTVSCGINDELIGTWRLVESDDSTFAPGMLFVFNSDRSLLVEPGGADISEEEKQQIIEARDDTNVTYNSSPNGDLSFILTKKDKRSVTVRMHYVLAEDTLSITDEEGLKLVFRRH